MSPVLAPFVRKGTGVHYELDLERLLLAYAQTDLGEAMSFHVSSPVHLAAAEHIRTTLGLRSKRAIPTDAFVWALGEPPAPMMTKVGGVPYLPASEPWPVIAGRKATFLAQFNFKDSMDLLPPLPADVLLVFARDEDVFCEEDQDGYQMFWVTQRERPMWTADKCPKSSWKIAPMWGVRHRTFDDKTRNARAHAAVETGAPYYTWQQTVLNATKIAGTPSDAQDGSHPTPRGYQFLCQLSSIQGAADVPWPWANRMKPLTHFGAKRDSPRASELSIIDMGVLRFFLDKKTHEYLHVSATSS